MPVNHPQPDDPIGPFKRLSHTQSAMLVNCQRQWYHRYKQGLRGSSPPILAMGRAVEAAVCRTLRESAVLVPADGQSEWLDSPLQVETPTWAGGELQPVKRPSRTEEGWRGPECETLGKADWPMSRNELFAWASARLRVHFDRCWRQAAEEWDKDANKVGDFDEFTRSDGQRALNMALKGIELHMEEVASCLENGGGPAIQTWRSGSSRAEWPAPDGFPYQWDKPHPSAKEDGSVSWVEAWELARPWFVDPDADDFSLTCIHREHWFQGEYDLVYRWDGAIRIIDIKASVGAGDRSGDYIKQMRTYAWLWWDMHEKQPPSGLEIWYLGAGVRKSIPVPSADELSEIGDELREAWDSTQEEDVIIDDFPAEPASFRKFSAGGVPAGDDLHPLTRCTHCDFVTVCSRSGPISLPSAETGFISIEDINPRLTAWGRAYRLSEELQFPFNAGIRKREFTLHMEEGQVNVVLDDEVELPDWEEGMGLRLFSATGGVVKKGMNWMKRLRLGRGGVIRAAEEREDGDCLMADVETMEVSVRGLAFSFDHRDFIRADGSDSKKWGARLVDDTGVIPVEGWDDKIHSMLLDGEPQRGQVVEAHGFAVAVNAGGQVILRAKKNRSGSSR
ncbi:MAG: PD-(D/E)XK nuclease family protein, partial [Candidatus Poseidoniales archaeon]|nr:PD-(D/E)XK nuclease family protein [Candidatus Poseidoniales archaeon]